MWCATLLLSNGLVVHKPTRPSREVECVGLREERGVGLSDWYLLIILPGQSRCFSLNVLNTSMHADILLHHSAHLMLMAWAFCPNLSLITLFSELIEFIKTFALKMKF